MEQRTQNHTGAHGPGENPGAYGVDEPAGNRPGVPMEATTPPETGAHWTTPQRQQSEGVHLHRKALDQVTPVYGTAQPPRGLSGAMRKAAYEIPEHSAIHWAMLLAADRVDVLEDLFTSGLGPDTLGAIGRRVRTNPLPALLLAAGVGYLLRRTDLAENAMARLLGTGSSRGSSSRSRRERLITWLNDAYAMELAQIPVLENHAKDAKDLPWVRSKHLEHLEQTRRHAEMVKGCIQRLDGSPSAGKAAVGRLTGAMNSVVSEPFDDEVVKNFLSDHAAENLEIASYRAIIALARELGDRETMLLCEEILWEEEAMAAWLKEHLPQAVRQTV
jgi:ferritin-like metal-binding protein YciE